ncbi:HAD family hydrolase [Streptomyces sp. NPDC087300]|uniref:HAD family hydrolase n=1 Tax=Streptomyces sp. NPDC087300 TaxID=3365780 RepID=UPI00381FAFD9
MYGIKSINGIDDIVKEVGVSVCRLAAIDLDGTLLASDLTLSGRSRAALDAARGAGIETVFVTARHLAALDHYPDLALVGEAVCCLGAAVHEFPSGRLTWARSIDPRTVAEVAVRIKREFPGLELAWVPESGPLGYEPAYSRPPLLGESYRGSPEEIGQPVLKLFAVGPELGRERPEFLLDALAGQVEIAHFGDGFVDLVAPGVGKVDTLRGLCERRGIRADEVAAFGDTAADIDMIRWAGHGVFMANGAPELRHHADEIAPDCDADGVAVVLERLVSERLAAESVRG